MFWCLSIIELPSSLLPFMLFCYLITLLTCCGSHKGGIVNISDYLTDTCKYISSQFLPILALTLRKVSFVIVHFNVTSGGGEKKNCFRHVTSYIVMEISSNSEETSASIMQVKCTLHLENVFEVFFEGVDNFFC